jgi:hypothetical protein
MVYRWSQAKFPKATFDYVNTAVGGTDCKYGDQNLQTLLDAKPDFLITEWAVSDSQLTSEEVAQYYGAVIDRIEARPNQPAAMMLITMAGDGSNWDYKDIPVGISRNIPIISEKPFLLPIQQEENLKEVGWNADGTHPNVLGDQILGELMKGYLSRQLVSQ